MFCDSDTGAEQIEIQSNITAVLGEDAYLSCRYLGDSQIVRSEWKRRVKSKAKRLVGFSNGKPFSRDSDFSEPDSVTNLTVRVRVRSVDVEGQYSCEFESEEENYFKSVFVTVIARPDIEILVNEETVNGTHYQSVSCSAVGGRPPPQISWLVKGLPPSGQVFTTNLSATFISNGTSTLSSVLRFPTHLQDDESVTCVVQHPALPKPELTTARVETYTRPNVTIKKEMVQREGKDFWVVSCISSGGRPDADISLALNANRELQRENHTDSGTQRVSVHLPLTEYEGHNITCEFDHPKFTQKESQVITLPIFYLTGDQTHSDLGNKINDFHATEFLELQEGQGNAVIRLQVTGNVPRYDLNCTKDDGPLPEGVDLAGRSLTVQGPVEHQHAGLYECVFSYEHLKATLQFNVTVKPQVIALVPPTIRVDLRTEDGLRVIECSAADAVPAANVSWLPPEGVSEDFWFNSTSHNGSHSVRGVLLLPACSPRELTAKCVINHPAFEEPENRSITLPLCARPNTTVIARTEWKDGLKYTKVICSADSDGPAAAVTWHFGNNSISSLTETEVQANGLVLARSSVYFLSSLYAGQDLTCMVTHPSLEAPEKRTIHIPVHKPPLLSVSMGRHQDSPLWLAVCHCRGEGVVTNLAWVLPENAKSQMSLQSEYEGHTLTARLTYKFPPALHEGQDLTCAYQFEKGITVNKTLHIPRYYITSVRVLNHTAPLQSHYSDQPVIYRVSVQESHCNQKILLQVDGNVPEYNLSCQRSDGSFALMDGNAMILQSELTNQVKGFYTCWASFYHHNAAVNIQVEVMNADEHLMLISLICISSASAIFLIFIVTLCVCCKRNSRKPQKSQEQESLSALTALMQEPGSPEVKKPEVKEEESKEYAALVSFSIVFDVKSTV